MIEHVKRWCVSCGVGRVRRAQAPAAHRGAGAKLARFTSACAFCQSFRQAQAPEQRKNGADESRRLSAKFVPSSCENRRKVARKSAKNQAKIDEKSLLAGFGRPKPFRGRVGMRSGRARDTPKPGRERSWDAPGAPRAARRRPRASPGRSQDAPGPVRSDIEVRAARQTQSDASSERFFIDLVLSRESSDVLFVSVFAMFCWLRAK